MVTQCLHWRQVSWTVLPIFFVKLLHRTCDEHAMYLADMCNKTQQLQIPLSWNRHLVQTPVRKAWSSPWSLSRKCFCRTSACEGVATDALVLFRVMWHVCVCVCGCGCVDMWMCWCFVCVAHSVFVITLPFKMWKMCCVRTHVRSHAYATHTLTHTHLHTRLEALTMYT